MIGITNAISSTAGGSGDFKANGSVPMSGNLNMVFSGITFAESVIAASDSENLIINTDSIDLSSLNGTYVPIMGVETPTGNYYAANKIYVDTKSAGAAVSTTLSTTWSGSGPYTQNITITGMTSTKNGHVGIAPSATKAQRDAARAAQLQLTSQGTNTVTITADGTKPTVTIPIVVTMLG